MDVETYEVSEVVSDGAVECDSEAIRLADELGLEGQKGLVSASGIERLPYRMMSEVERIVYGAILPENTTVEKFDSMPIPLRVLQVIAHARSLEIFKELRVWHSRDARVKDPLLVAYKGDQWSSIPFILARWGVELLSFADCALAAAKIIQARAIAKTTKAIAEAQMTLDSVKSIPYVAMIEWAQQNRFAY